MSEKLLNQLREAILNYNKELVKRLVEEIVSLDIDPIKALDAMTAAMRQVGDGFERGELWLPDLVGAGDAMSAAVPILEKKISGIGIQRTTLGTVVIGTVAGDIHNIGKSMVAALMAAEGFEIHDLGVDVEAERFVKAIEEFEADILVMSALLTMTAPQQQQTIEALALRGLRDRLKVMVGGGAITQAFADSIGADGYHPTAVGAAKLARILLE